MKKTLAILTTFLCIYLPALSLGDIEKDLTHSSWLAENSEELTANAEMYSLAVTWHSLLIADETSWNLYMKVWTDEQNRPDRDIDLARKSARIKRNLADVVLETLGRTIPLLQKHPDKILTQALLLHAIRFSRGGNEKRWEGVVESLCSVNDEWTIEALRELEPAERKKFKSMITGVGETEQSEPNLKFLRLLEKAVEESAGVLQVTEPRRASPNGYEDNTHSVPPNGRIKELKNAAPKQDSGDQPAPDPAQISDVKLWHDGRITPEQPFKAQVMGVIPGWTGDTILLKETEKNGRYCIANLTMDRFHYEIVDASEFDRKEFLGKGAIFLSPPADVGGFSWSMGIWKIGTRFGTEDSVTEWYQKLGIQKLEDSENISD